MLEGVQILLSLIVLYAVIVYLVKFCLLRRPQPKAKRVDLDKSIPLTEVEEKNEGVNKDSERWCIIGGGFSGLTIAAQFQQRRIPFTIFEREERLGGNWQYGTYDGVHMISSKKTTEITDYPMPDSYPDFPSAKQVLAYLNDYASHFELLPHIQYNMEVERADPIADGGQWRVTLKSGEVRQYKGVIVCNGHDWASRIPTYPGTPTLEIMHSRKYKNAEILKGKRVLVVGGGNSGTDIACDAAKNSELCGLSLRRGYWFIPRLMLGRPIAEVFTSWIPHCIQQVYLAAIIYVIHGGFEKYGLQKPAHSIFEHPVSVADALFQEIRKGRINIFKDIQSIDGKTVTFVDGAKQDFDLVVFATGYHAALPMIQHILTYQNGIPQLLHGVVHPQLKNLYVVGYGQARSGCGPLLHSAATTVARCVRVQDKLTFPIGVLLRKSGSRFQRSGKASNEVIVDPFKAFAKEFLGSKLIRFLPVFERWVMNTSVYDPARVCATVSRMNSPERATRQAC